MKRLRILFALPCAIFAACAGSLGKPYIAYEDGDRPLSDTAVLVARANQGEYELKVPSLAVPGVAMVDGKQSGCVGHNEWGDKGCPWWVRVTPGTHAFTVRIKYNFAATGLSTFAFREVDLPLVIPNMQAKHTYAVRYQRRGEQFAVTYEDLGVNSEYGVRLCGFRGDCKSTLTPKFE